MARIELTWTPADPETAISYEVRYALESPTPAYLYITTTGTSINILGLLDNGTYFVGVRTYCTGDIWSEWTQKRVVTCNSVTSCYMEGVAEFVGSIKIITKGTQTITNAEMQITSSEDIVIDWGDGVMETVSPSSFSHFVTDGSVVNVMGLITDFTLLSSIKIEYLSTIRHEKLNTITITNNELERVEINDSLSLASIDFSNCTDLIYINGNNCNLTTLSVNTLLSNIDSYGNSDGFCDIANNTPPTSGPPDGLTAKSNLISKGWTVITD